MGQGILLAVTGSQGQVVQSLVERGASFGVRVLPLGRPQLDLLDADSVRRSLEQLRPDVIVNAAAYTAVDKAESEIEAAMQVNEGGAGLVAASAAALGRPIIQLSTDYVFDGLLDRPYREDDEPNPRGAYGRSKLAGEQAVAARNAAHVIVRTAWVYSPFGHNFLKTMLRLAETRQQVAVVADQSGSPTSALDIADGVLAIAQALHRDPKNRAHYGLFHMTGAGEAVWADFAAAIFDRLAETGGPRVEVRRITTAQYPTAAARPANSRLNNGKLLRTFGIALPAWQVSTRACVDRVSGRSGGRP